MSHAAHDRIVAPKRRWFQFGLRTFLILPTVLAAWIGLTVRHVYRQKEAIAAFKAYDAVVRYDHQKVVVRAGLPGFEQDSWAPDWLMSRLGVDVFHDVDFVDFSYNRYNTSNVTAGDLGYLEALPEIRMLFLGGAQLTDDSMKHIGRLKNLEHVGIFDASEITDRGTSHFRNLRRLKNLHLSNSRISDESLATFSRLPGLEHLSLQDNHLTDRGLAYLREMNQLKGLSLSRNPITDDGLACLTGLASLESLDLQETQVTAKGLEHLAGLNNLKSIALSRDPGELTRVRQSLPNCTIKW